MARNESFFKRLNKKNNLIPITNKNHRGVSGIYCIVNTKNSRFYIGSAVNLYNRKTVHMSQLKKNKHHNCFLQRDYNKSKKYNFKFYEVEVVKEKEILLKIEQRYINEVFGNENCYNLNPIAGSFLGRKHSEQTKKKLSMLKKGKKLSKETREKMSKSHTGIPLSKNHSIRLGHSEDTKEKISNSMRGSKNHFFGKHHTEETKEKIRKKLLGTKSKHGCAVCAINIKTKEEIIFNSMCEASKKLGVGQGHISNVCSGKLKQIKGWKFTKVVNNG